MDELDSIFLTREALDVAGAILAVADARAGGIDIFVGVTRAETDAVRGGLVALAYSAYEEMALGQMRKLVGVARERWPICRVALQHRLGVVEVGEASVVVAVSCSHREEAFAACRYLIDRLKAEVPIWKQDVYAQGQRWHHDPR